MLLLLRGCGFTHTQILLKGLWCPVLNYRSFGASLRPTTPFWVLGGVSYSAQKQPLPDKSNYQPELTGERTEIGKTDGNNGIHSKGSSAW